MQTSDQCINLDRKNRANDGGKAKEQNWSRPEWKHGWLGTN